MNRNDMNNICRMSMEMLERAGSDLVGEQRAFYLPRLREIFVLLTKLFPENMCVAVGEAVDRDEEMERTR